MAANMVDSMAGRTLPVFDNSSMWYNFTAWTAQHFGYAVNMSRLAPSLEDLVWAGPRMVMRLGRLGSLISFPDAIDGFGQRIIPESTQPGIFHVTGSALSGTRITGSAPAAVASLAAEQDSPAFTSRFSMEGAKGLGSVFSYATSKWAFCCIAMAAILNRTVIFAATRRRLRLKWYMRLLLRFLPILLFALQIRQLLQSMQCQTSPDFAELRWGNVSRSEEVMFAQSNTFLHGLSSTLLLRPSDYDSCIAVNMIPPADARGSANTELRGSLSRLWPLFGTFCLSEFVETVSCAVQGRPVAVETGMTLFKHSLAFAEADAAISNQLGWSLFSNSTASKAQTSHGNNIALTRSMIMKRVNTSPEVLLVAYLSAMSHITSHVLGVLNLQTKLRLYSTGLWGLCFIANIFWSAINFSFEDASSHGLLRYPTVCVLGFIPHVIVLLGMVVCSFVYLLALLLCAFSSPNGVQNDPHRSFMRRIVDAHGNMQANVSLSSLRIRSEMDFYTALLRAGFAAITMASEAVYLNEDRRVNLKPHTWLEDERLHELDDLRAQWIGSGSRFDSVGAFGLVPNKNGQGDGSGGYAREKVAQKATKSGGGNRRIRDGIGAAESSGRWFLAVEFIMHINKLLIVAGAVGMRKMLTFVGIRRHPRWLTWLAQRPKEEAQIPNGERRGLFGTVTNGDRRNGSSTSSQVPRKDRDDTEAILRHRLVERGMGSDGARSSLTNTVDEDEVDAALYSYWLRGGYWGNADSSGDYSPPMELDNDLTSVVSEDSLADRKLEEWEDESDSNLDDGTVTPTQRSPSFTDTDGLDTPLDLSNLARLLHPSTIEERDEARILAARLTSDRPMTRAAYARAQQRLRTRILTSHRGRAAALHRMTADEEMQLLEQILLTRRGDQRARGGEDSSWAAGAAGLGSDGPQCVVCQSAPRTIIVWPCRCLSLCDDCRVSLAMNNFDNCVCCRREVLSFSRIFVP